MMYVSPPWPVGTIGGFWSRGPGSNPSKYIFLPPIFSKTNQKNWEIGPSFPVVTTGNRASFPVFQLAEIRSRVAFTFYKAVPAPCHFQEFLGDYSPTLFPGSADVK